MAQATATRTRSNTVTTPAVSVPAPVIDMTTGAITGITPDQMVAWNGTTKVVTYPTFYAGSIVSVVMGGKHYHGVVVSTGRNSRDVRTFTLAVIDPTTMAMARVANKAGVMVFSKISGLPMTHATVRFSAPAPATKATSAKVGPAYLQFGR